MKRRNRYNTETSLGRKLIPPVQIKLRTCTALGGEVRSVIGDKPNDQGKVIDGREYIYHPTKGWRFRREL